MAANVDMKGLPLVLRNVRKVVRDTICDYATPSCLTVILYDSESKELSAEFFCEMPDDSYWGYFPKKIERVCLTHRRLRGQEVVDALFCYLANKQSGKPNDECIVKY